MKRIYILWEGLNFRQKTLVCLLLPLEWWVVKMWGVLGLLFIGFVILYLRYGTDIIDIRKSKECFEISNNDGLKKILDMRRYVKESNVWRICQLFSGLACSGISALILMIIFKNYSVIFGDDLVVLWGLGVALFHICLVILQIFICRNSLRFIENWIAILFVPAVVCGFVFWGVISLNTNILGLISAGSLSAVVMLASKAYVIIRYDKSYKFDFYLTVNVIISQISSLSASAVFVYYFIASPFDFMGWLIFWSLSAFLEVAFDIIIDLFGSTIGRRAEVMHSDAVKR